MVVEKNDHTVLTVSINSGVLKGKGMNCLSQQNTISIFEYKNFSINKKIIDGFFCIQAAANTFFCCHNIPLFYVLKMFF